MRRQFKGYEPLSTEDWAKLQQANIVRRVLYPLGKGESGEAPTPPAETFHILAEDNSPLLTEGGDNIDFDFV
jgi:hypothetical protein